VNAKPVRGGTGRRAWIRAALAVALGSSVGWASTGSASTAVTQSAAARYDLRVGAAAGDVLHIQGTSKLSLSAVAAHFVRDGARSAVPGFALDQLETANLIVRDRIEALKQESADAGRSTVFTRHFERARTAGSVEQFGNVSTFERVSRLEGRTVRFDMGAAEPAGQRVAVVDGSEEGGPLDPQLLDGLAAQLDFHRALPPEPVEVGARWTVPAETVHAFFQPFGHLRTLAESGGGPWQALQREAFAAPTGKLTAELVRVDGDAGDRRAVVRITGRVLAAARDGAAESPDAARLAHAVGLRIEVDATLSIHLEQKVWVELRSELRIALSQEQNEAREDGAVASRELEFEGDFELALSQRLERR